MLKLTYGFEQAEVAQVVLSAFSLSTVVPDKLRPIQTIPHFDTAAENQFAVLHYLCDEQHGGTSFYRHRETGFESINQQRISRYASLLKQQAIASKLHENLNYISGDTDLFELLHSVSAQNNRAVIYPSNVLHSGNIRVNAGLSANPKLGRLTISSFLVLA